MARIISIVNQKGGTGKSACTANLAVGLAQKNMKVLIVDADPQSDVSAGFGYRDCDDSNETLTALMDAVMKDEDIPSDCYIRHHAEGIDIICSNIGLAGTEVRLVNAMSREYLSEQLTAEFGKGFDKSNLRKMRQFYYDFPIRDTLCPELSWSHYRVLMRINDEQARRFYMEECAKAAWSVRQLERQIDTMYYQRILASQDKIAVANEIQTTEPKPEYEKIVKDPYVMEFLQIQPDTHIYEGDLEQALIDHLQHFCIEIFHLSAVRGRIET